MITGSWRGSLFVTVLLLGGCLGSVSSAPTEKFYQLPAPPEASSTAGQPPASATVFALDSVDARGVYVERALLYRSALAGSPLQQYPFASWAEPPDVMLQDALLGSMRRAFGVTQVLAPGQRGLPAVRIAMRLRALEQIRDGSSAQARFAATYTAIDRSGEVLFVLDWDRQAPTTGASPLEFVTALGGLVNQANRDLVERLREASAGAGASGS